MPTFNESVTQVLSLDQEAVGWPRDWSRFISHLLELSDVIDREVEWDVTVVSALALTQTIQDFLAQFYEPMTEALTLSDTATPALVLNRETIESLDLQHQVLQVEYMIHTLALSDLVGDTLQFGRDTLHSLALAHVIDDTLLHPEDHVLTLSDSVVAVMAISQAIVDTCVLTHHVEGWIVGAVPECTSEKWPETGDPSLDVCP